MGNRLKGKYDFTTQSKRSIAGNHQQLIVGTWFNMQLIN